MACGLLVVRSLARDCPMSRQPKRAVKQATSMAAFVSCYGVGLCTLGTVETLAMASLHTVNSA